MAIQRICDSCPAVITQRPIKVEHLGVDLFVYVYDYDMSADYVSAHPKPPIDICPACLADLTAKLDTRDKPAQPNYSRFKWGVTEAGVRTPGPHVLFMNHGDADAYVKLDPERLKAERL